MRNESMKSDVEHEKASRNSTPDRILFLDSFRALAIIMVVGVHTLGYCIPLPYNQKEVISFIVYTISVPVFFLVDGYLFAWRTKLSKKNNYFKNVQKNLFRLLVPWVIFTVLYTVLRYCFEITGFLGDKVIVGHSLKDVAISAYGSVYAPQMYFLFSLLLIRLFEPIFKIFALVKNYFFILSLFFCYYATYLSSITFISPFLEIDGGQEPILHALWGIQYYLFGIICFKTSKIVDLHKLFVPFLLLFVVALLIQSSLEPVGFALVQYLYLITAFLFFVSFGKRLHFLDIIGQNTMGIYLIHTPVVLKGVSLLLNQFIIIPIWSFLSVLFCTFILTIFIVITINYTPYGVLLFGTTNNKPKFLSDK
jgi:surface polysaccharide O-acyltransferase-like enzyme